MLRSFIPEPKYKKNLLIANYGNNFKTASKYKKVHSIIIVVLGTLTFVFLVFYIILGREWAKLPLVFSGSITGVFICVMDLFERKPWVKR